MFHLSFLLIYASYLALFVLNKIDLIINVLIVLSKIDPKSSSLRKERFLYFYLNNFN